MKFTKFGVFTLIVIAFPFNAIAESRFALHAGVNFSSADTVLVPAQLDSTFGRSFSGAGGRLGIDVIATERVRIETGWARFGSNSGMVSVGGTCPMSPCPVSTVNARQRGSAYWLAITPTIRRGDYAFFAKLGAARVSIETRASIDRGKETDTSVLVGAGLRYAFTPSVGLRVDLERLGSEARTAGIGVEYRF